MFLTKFNAPDHGRTKRFVSTMKDDESTGKKIMKIDSSDVHYTTKDYGDDKKQFVVHVRPGKKHVRIYPMKVVNASLIPMRNEEDIPTNEFTKSNFVQVFGSAKAKKVNIDYMHSMLSIDEQKRVSNLLDEGTLKDQKENSQSEESGMTSILKSFFPTLSDESENLEDEIDISSIIPTHILKLLKNMDFVQNWMKKEMELDTQFSSLPSFIQYMVGELRKDLANVKEHLLDYCIVGYLYFLMQLAKSYSTRVFKLHRLPPQFKNNSVLSEFLMKQFIVKSDNGKQGQMMKNERETLISHILILVLYLEGFDFNIRKIHSDLHIRIDELTGIARSLHCTVAEETVVHDGNTEFAHRLRLTVKNVLNDKFLSSGPFRRSKKRRN